MSEEEATVARPTYKKRKQDDTAATNMWMVTCSEGWRTSIVCTGMYEWAADWLLEVLDRRPFAPGNPS